MRLFSKMLIATDGSDGAKFAATQGLALAKILDAEVTALSVVDDGSYYGNRGLRRAAVANIPILQEVSEAAVEQIRAEGEKMGITVRTLVKSGVPAGEIIRASGDYDLVVMGSLGLTGLAHFLTGSVAEKVVRFASCPVLVVRGKKDH